ncbi:MAG TPA: extracellular solute-binding protein [Clostridiales bacterium]|nr:extracellular solute-binding protein [Clostridiales bacterium]
MRKEKKFIVLLMVTVLSIALLGGCGKSASDANKGDGANSSGNQVQTSGKDSSEVTKIEFFQTKREATETMDQIIAAFEKEYPNIKVEQNIVPDADTVLMARAASDDMPDLFNHYPTDANFLQFAKDGKVKDLTDKPYTANVIPEYLESVKVDGKNYIMPFSIEFFGIYYNVDKFEAGGYEVPKTWAELVALADKIEQDGDIPFILSNKDSWTISQALVFNIETKDRGSHAEFYQQLLDGKASFETDSIFRPALEKTYWMVEHGQPDSISVSYDQAINDFATGKGVMFPQGIYSLPSLEAANPDLNVAMFPMPNDSGNVKETVRIDMAIAAGKNSNNNEEAVDTFLSYLTSKEGAQMFSDLDHSLSAIKTVEATIPKAQAVVDSINANRVLDGAAPPAGFEQAKRSELQTLVMDGDVDKCLKRLDIVWKEAVSGQ